MHGNIGLKGRLGTRVIKRETKAPWTWRVKHWLKVRWRELPVEFLIVALRLLGRFIPGVRPPMHGRTYIKVLTRDGRIIDYGHIGVHLITDVGFEFVTDAWQNTVELEDMNFHGIGTDGTAAASGDTDLIAELTTEYQTDNTRASGTQGENGTTTYQTQATNTVDATVSIQEWGLFSASGVGSGTIFDRQTFSAINLSSGDSLQTTYDLSHT